MLPFINTVPLINVLPSAALKTVTFLIAIPVLFFSVTEFGKVGIKIIFEYFFEWVKEDQ